MIRTPKLFWVSFLLCYQFISLQGQKPPVKFGKIDIEDLKMTVYPHDSTAEAVILCDYGTFSPEKFEFTRILRIKILKKEGTSRANLILPVTSKSQVRGRTYNLVDGKVVEEKLRNESVFKEQITENRFEVRLGMPNVRVGSIFEVSYLMTGIPSEWRFQDQIPIRWSELRMPDHTYYSLQKNFSGYEPLKLSTDWRWIGENMPAFRPEPHINSPSNYIRKVQLELASINIPDYIFRDYTSSWDAVNKYFDEHMIFGEQTRGVFIHLKEDADRIENTCVNDKDKIMAALETIRRNVQWDERNRLYPNSNLNYIYNNKKIGSSADVNFLLLQLLKKLDFQAFPMVLSTRNNGKVYEYFPTIEGFNYMIVYVNVGNESYFLDATDKFCPAGMLPEKCLNGKGFVIMRDKGQWVEIPFDKASSKLVYCEMILDNAGNISGSMNCRRTEYTAAKFRKYYDSFNSTEEYLDEFEKSNGGCEVTDFSVENFDSIYLSPKENLQLEFTNKAMVMGDDIYLEPVLFDKISENPFRMEDRVYPVDFTYPRDLMYASQFILPDGYFIEEMPESCRLVLADNSASFVYSVTPMDKTIQVMYRFQRLKPVYYQTEYKELKELYNQIIIKLAEPIILKRKDNES